MLVVAAAAAIAIPRGPGGMRVLTSLHEDLHGDGGYSSIVVSVERKRRVRATSGRVVEWQMRRRKRG